MGRTFIQAVKVLAEAGKIPKSKTVSGVTGYPEYSHYDDYKDRVVIHYYDQDDNLVYTLAHTRKAIREMLKDIALTPKKK